MSWGFEQKFARLINPRVPRTFLHLPAADGEIKPNLLSADVLSTPADGFIAKYCTNQEDQEETAHGQ